MWADCGPSMFAYCSRDAVRHAGNPARCRLERAQATDGRVGTIRASGGLACCEWVELYAECEHMKRKSLLFALGAMAVLAAGPRTAPHVDISLVRVPNGGIQPQVMVGRGGILHLLYYAGDPKNGDLFYVKSPDYGSRWSAPLRVNSTPGSALAIGTIRGGQIALGKGGRIHVAWDGSSVVQSKGPLNPEAGQKGSPMLYSRLNEGGTAFEPERSLMNHTFGLDGGGTVAADSAGNVYVAWHGKAAGAAAGEAGRQVWIAASRDDGATFAPEEAAWREPTGACGCCGMSMFGDSKGVVRALYRSATENIHRDIFLLTSLDHGRSFDGRKLYTWDINACPMSSMSFAEGAGMVAGAWETGGQVYFENLSQPNGIPLSAPAEGKGRRHPRIAIAPNGEMLMVWTEGTGWQRGGSLAWQVFGRNAKSVGDIRVQPGVAVWRFDAVAAKPDGFVILY